jgi:hypothetical protein
MPPTDPLFPRNAEGPVDGYSSLSNPTPDAFSQFRRPSRRESFLMNFRASNGPPQIVAVVILLAMSFGATVGIIPSIMTERYAREKYGYDGEYCHSFEEYADKPEECLLGSADAQTAAAVSELVANTLTFITSSLIGSMSDVHGRRGTML